MGKKTTSAFDVTMGSYDGAEICELVGLYLLSQLQNLNINVGLYRDDGLALTKQTLREAEMTKKKLCKIFKDNNLRIAVEANKKVTDFLDITLDLHTGSAKPYKKKNERHHELHPLPKKSPALNCQKITKRKRNTTLKQLGQRGYILRFGKLGDFR